MKDLNYKIKLPKVDVNSADERRKPVIEDVRAGKLKMRS